MLLGAKTLTNRWTVDSYPDSIVLGWKLGMVKRLPGRKLDRGAQTTDEYEVRFLTSYNINTNTNG